MYEQVYVNPDIYKIDVPLPDNPLQNLNCYVLKTPQKNLIIDTGFSLPECLEALQRGLNELEIDLDKTELFLTHLHSDHVGLAFEIMPEESTIYMSSVDYSYFKKISMGEYDEKSKLRILNEGFTQEEVNLFWQSNSTLLLESASRHKITTVDDWTKIQVGTCQFTCVATPGHTPGHMCLYLEEEKLMFLGDHVLFDITPNIYYWSGVEDSLQDYLDSLIKIRNYEIETPFAAHRQNGTDIKRRIAEIIEHHENRLAEIISIVKQEEGLNAQEIAIRMSWAIPCKAWGDFPIIQRWFAMGEAIAHLDHLCQRKILSRDFEQQQGKYYLL